MEWVLTWLIIAFWGVLVRVWGTWILNNYTIKLGVIKAENLMRINTQHGFLSQVERHGRRKGKALNQHDDACENPTHMS